VKKDRGGRTTSQRGLLARSRATAPVTLLTDFGTADYYVGAVKAVVLTKNPAATVVDISHDIPPQDIEAAAFVLLACYRSFPPGTVHVVVVDPGVGSDRRAIVVRAGGQFFVAPDNGVLSYILEKELDPRVVQITSQEYFAQPVSNTFHGRDVFAPVAAMISLGASLDSIGPEIKDPVRLEPLKPVAGKGKKVKGRIIHIDRFGNCVTNIDQTCSPNGFTGASLNVKGTRIESFRAYYGEGKSGKLFAIWGSAGFLEISVQNRSAAKMLKAQRGDEVVLLRKS